MLLWQCSSQPQEATAGVQWLQTRLLPLDMTDCLASGGSAGQLKICLAHEVEGRASAPASCKTTHPSAARLGSLSLTSITKALPSAAATKSVASSALSASRVMAAPQHRSSCSNIPPNINPYRSSIQTIYKAASKAKYVWLRHPVSLTMCVLKRDSCAAWAHEN